MYLLKKIFKEFKILFGKYRNRFLLFLLPSPRVYSIPFPEHNEGPRNMFNYSQSCYLDKKFLISDTKYNSTSYTKIYNTIYFIMNKFPLYKTKKYLDLNFNTLIQIWIKTFNLQKKKKLKIFNKPYQSIALELYTKLPYKLDKNILIKIIKEVKKKELLMNYFKLDKIDIIYNIICNNKSNIFSHINKRSYYMYLLKKNF